MASRPIVRWRYRCDVFPVSQWVAIWRCQTAKIHGLSPNSDAPKFPKAIENLLFRETASTPEIQNFQLQINPHVDGNPNQRANQLANSKFKTSNLNFLPFSLILIAAASHLQKDLLPLGCIADQPLFQFTPRLKFNFQIQLC